MRSGWTSTFPHSSPQWYPELPVVQGDSQELPLGDGSVDVIICNHVYEHVLDAERLAAEIHRVLKPEGIAYLGLGNRLGIMEPHHRLPFLSWLPPALADRYMRFAGKGDSYHERFRTAGGLDRLFARFHLWDYTFPVIRHPQVFSAADVIPGALASLPALALRAAMPLIPTFLWVATKSERTPLGVTLTVGPVRRR
jgi:SAM-dependent methyltransferase